jgi:hypothetical protein
VLRIEARRQIVASLQELLLGSHDARFCLYIRLHSLLKGLHRSLGVKGITKEIKSQSFALIRLILEGWRGWQSLRGLKQVGAIVLGKLLFWPRLRHGAWGLRLLHSLG